MIPKIFIEAYLMVIISLQRLRLIFNFMIYQNAEKIPNQTHLRDILPTMKHYDTELEDGMEDVSN